MPRNNKINYIELPASDLPRINKFFTELFGWTFTEYGPDYLAFNDGVMDGGFFKSDKVATTDAGSALVIFYHDDLESILEKVKAVGGTIHAEIFSFPGGRRFHFLDPHGNEYAIWCEAPEAA